MIKLGVEDRALGALVRAWMLAQKWFATPERMIPVGEWEKQGCSDALIEVGLAKRKGEKIWICGAEEQFSWMTKAIEAGKKGGLKTQEKRLKQPLSNPQAGVKGFEPSLLLAPSSLLPAPGSLLESQSSNTVPAESDDSPHPIDPNEPDELQSQSKPKKQKAPAPTTALWEAYADEYSIRYGAEPVRNAKVNSQLKQILQSLGADESPQVLRHYVRSNNGWYAQNGRKFSVRDFALQQFPLRLVSEQATTHEKKN